MKPIYKKRIKNAALIWVGFAFLLLVTYITVLGPQIKTRKQVERLLAETKQSYNSAMMAAKEDTLKQMKDQIEQRQNILDSFVVGHKESTNLTLDISQIANEKKVSGFSISGRGGGSRAVEIPNCNQIRENRIGIEFDAGFKSFATFLNTLERHKPVVFVDTFKIIRFDNTASANANKVQMDLAVFVREQQDDSTTNAI
jgi:Tfp pilus assembly protein PilO